MKVLRFAEHYVRAKTQLAACVQLILKLGWLLTYNLHVFYTNPDTASHQAGLCMLFKIVYIPSFIPIMFLFSGASKWYKWGRWSRRHAITQTLHEGAHCIRWWVSSAPLPVRLLPLQIHVHI